MARRRGQLVSDTTETTTVAASEASLDEEVAKDLLARARREGVSLVGPGGLLAGLTKTVLETALEAELTDHLGYEKHDPVGRNGANSRNGARSKTVITEVGPEEVEVPRDRNGSFDPRIVPERARRLGGVDDMVISLVSRRASRPARSRRTSPRSTGPTCRGRRSRRSPTGCSSGWRSGGRGRSKLGVSTWIGPGVLV